MNPLTIKSQERSLKKLLLEYSGNSRFQRSLKEPLPAIALKNFVTIEIEQKLLPELEITVQQVFQQAGLP